MSSVDCQSPANAALAFANQFLLARAAVDLSRLEGWVEKTIGAHWRLLAHPRLELVQGVSGAVEVTGLGNLYDVSAPERDNAAVVQHIADDLDAAEVPFERIEALVDGLSGRWILIVSQGATTRLYHDACGLKPVFYTTGSPDQRTIVSQPGLLDHLGIIARDTAMAARFESLPNTGGWPANTLPFPGVAQLLPNHYLEIDTGVAERYWPRQDLVPREVESAADDMIGLISNSITAHANRWPVAFSATGGIDSRMIIACCPEEIRKTAKFYTFVSEKTKSFDKWTPKKIAKILGLDYATAAIYFDEDVAKYLSINTGHMYFDRAAPNVTSQAAAVGGRVYCSGLCGEVFRCFYFTDGAHPASLDARRLQEIARFGGNDVVDHEFSRWLDAFPEVDNLLALDLFYWENRLGGWSAMGSVYKEAILEVSPPMNSRRILEIALSVPVAYRCEPYVLPQRIVEKACPAIASVPYNKVRFGAREHMAQMPLPWRVKKRFGWT